MRNIFCRQATTAPTLRERATALREGLSGRDAAPAPVERAALRDRLLTLYAEDRAARPISGREDDTTAKRAADLVTKRLRELAHEIVALPAPATLDGLRVTALASAILCEADAYSDDPTALAAVGLTRAALAVTGTPLPPGFVGFGDEIDHEERDDALYAAAGSVPAWAVAEIEAEDASLRPSPAPAVATSEPDALSRAMIDAWKAWEATLYKSEFDAEAEAAFERASELRDSLIDAAMALPATHESIPAKALACAWMEWVEAERPSQSRDDYGPADQLVYDINATIRGRGAEVSAMAPLAVSPLCSANFLTAAGIDIKGMPLLDLMALHDSAHLLRDVADAISCQPRSVTNDRLNGAGRMIEWLGEGLTAVAEAAREELRARTPSGSFEARQRFSTLAPGIIQNGDPSETLALAREILAAVEP